jgi:putative tryptophan/tyrosine transport system substrate-binding protein
MRRRDLFRGFAASVVAWSTVADAQSPGFRIGYLANLAPETTRDLFDAFREALKLRGYAEGQNLTIVPRTSQNPLDTAATELVALKPDIVVAWATPAVSAAKRATQTIPIVMVGIADPVAVGFVTSLSRPHANITGTTNLARDLGGNTKSH